MIQFPKTIQTHVPISNCSNYILSSAPFNFACNTNHALENPLFDKRRGCWPSFSESTILTSVHHPLPPQLQSSSLFFTSNTSQCICQGASQRSQFSQNSGTNQFSEFLHLAHFPSEFSVQDTACQPFSITRSVLECKFRLPCRQDNPTFSKHSAKQTPCTQKTKIPNNQTIAPFLIIQKTTVTLQHSLKGGSAFATHWVVEGK